jgi:hypothetical protein
VELTWRVELTVECFHKEWNAMSLCTVFAQVILLIKLYIINSCLTSNAVLQRVHVDEYLMLRWTKNLLKEFLPLTRRSNQKGRENTYEVAVQRLLCDTPAMSLRFAAQGSKASLASSAT